MTENKPTKRVSVLEGDDARAADQTAGNLPGDAPRSGAPLIAVLLPLALLAIGGYFLVKGLTRERPKSEPSRPTTSRQFRLDEIMPKSEPRVPRAQQDDKRAMPPAPTPAQQRAPARPDDGKATGTPATAPKPRPGSTGTDNKAKHGSGPAERIMAPAPPAADKPPASAQPQPAATQAEDIAQLTRAIEADYTSIEAWKNRAHAYLMHQQREQSIADYDMAVALDPLQALSYNDRGIVYFQMGNHERARNDFNWSLTLDPNEKLALFNRGLLHFETGENAASERDFAAFLEKEPGDAEAWRWRGQARFRTGNHKAALDDFSKALSLDGDDKLALAYRCGAQIVLENLEEAERDCTAAIGKDADLGEALNNLAWIHFKRGQHSTGLPFAERAVRSSPDDAAYLDTRAHLLEALGERQRALDDYRAALKKDPKQKESIEGLKRMGETP